MPALKILSNHLTQITHLHTFSASIAFTFKDCASANLSLSSITILLGGRTAKKEDNIISSFSAQFSYFCM